MRRKDRQLGVFQAGLAVCLAERAIDDQRGLALPERDAGMHVPETRARDRRALGAAGGGPGVRGTWAHAVKRVCPSTG